MMTAMYVDNAPCSVCGSAIELRPHGPEPRSERHPDGPTDERVCTNPDCATNADPSTSETPDP